MAASQLQTGDVQQPQSLRERKSRWECWRMATAPSPAGAGDHDTRTGGHRQSSGTCLPLQSFSPLLTAPPAGISPLINQSPARSHKKHTTRQHLQISNRLSYRAVKPMPMALVAYRDDFPPCFFLEVPCQCKPRIMQKPPWMMPPCKSMSLPHHRQ